MTNLHKNGSHDRQDRDDSGEDECHGGDIDTSTVAVDLGYDDRCAKQNQSEPLQQRYVSLEEKSTRKIYRVTSYECWVREEASATRASSRPVCRCRQTPPDKVLLGRAPATAYHRISVSAVAYAPVNDWRYHDSLVVYLPVNDCRYHDLLVVYLPVHDCRYHHSLVAYLPVNDCCYDDSALGKYAPHGWRRKVKGIEEQVVVDGIDGWRDGKE